MSLEDLMIVDAAACGNPSLTPGCELVTIIPSRSTTGVPVNVNVFRHGPRPIEGLAGEYTEPSLEVFIPAGQGISSIDTGGMTVTVARKFGGTAERIPVKEILTQDGGGWLVKLI